LLYDHLGGRQRLPASERVDLRSDPAGGPLKPELHKGFAYADCFVDDARLVVLNALDAHERGAEILTRTRCTAARRANGLWYAALAPSGGGRPRQVRARALVNATGPWVSRFLAERLQQSGPSHVRLVKGGHIVVPRLYAHPDPYILQNDDGRVVFVIPYENSYTLIGTTDVDYDGDPAAVTITDDEIAYLCRAVSRYLRTPLAPDQVAWTYAGVRPLYDDASGDVSKVTRDYVLDLDGAAGEAPLLSVFGGKLTTYRKLAEAALAHLAPHFPQMKPRWTASALLPGAENLESQSAMVAALCARCGWLPTALARRWASCYGSRSWILLEGVQELSDLGEHLGAGLYAREVDYLCQHEWAMQTADILWRRTKLGLFMTPSQQARLARYLRVHSPNSPEDAHAA
jgi:glycerol-3-phosphate dehydrogenase